MYSAGRIVEPYAESSITDGEQDMWVQEIDFIPAKEDQRTGCIRHIGCVEVRAEEKVLLTQRVGQIIDALNFMAKVNEQ